VDIMQGNIGKLGQIPKHSFLMKNGNQIIV
jgi:hypothetical protein